VSERILGRATRARHSSAKRQGNGIAQAPSLASAHLQDRQRRRSHNAAVGSVACAARSSSLTGAACCSRAACGHAFPAARHARRGKGSPQSLTESPCCSLHGSRLCSLRRPVELSYECCVLLPRMLAACGHVCPVLMHAGWRKDCHPTELDRVLIECVAAGSWVPCGRQLGMAQTLLKTLPPPTTQARPPCTTGV
jgi:hypothetical protein